MKELLFSVGPNDLRFDYYRGSGKGGQKRNKTSNAVRCTHLESGAVGQAEDTRSQHQNKILAFKRMAETKKFKFWHRFEVARKMGKIHDAEEAVRVAMRSPNIRLEIKKDGKWVEIPLNSELS